MIMTVLLPLWSNEGCLWCRLIRDRPLRASVGFHMELGSLAAPAREHSHPKACCHTNDLKSFDEQKDIERHTNFLDSYGLPKTNLKIIWKASEKLEGHSISCKTNVSKVHAASHVAATKPTAAASAKSKHFVLALACGGCITKQWNVRAQCRPK